ncbi:hypothetical protein H6G00_01500 [Leptolyngbya sp. FACHB-541]|uniref:hypothetical protein n=1 Tax=Leptolyngbya sp. FACHB-541 TaxID=2692810 RepID=UPI001687CF58|nr:hypothetical protein [Leptolyngbya sp. FACHB-541]MBD1995305.1 hypothetical protein [Leptolyngbya sp. FACHB-541]
MTTDFFHQQTANILAQFTGKKIQAIKIDSIENELVTGLFKANNETFAFQMGREGEGFVVREVSPHTEEG